MMTAKLPSGYGMVQTKVMRLGELSIQAKALYSLLCSYTGANDFCFPGINTLSKDLDLSRPMIFKYIQELESFSLIEKKKTYNGKGQTNNNYYIKYISD